MQKFLKLNKKYGNKAMAKKRSKILVQALPLKSMQSDIFGNAARQV